MKTAYARFVYWVAALPSHEVYCFFVNARLWLRGRKIRIAPHDMNGITVVRDGEVTIHVCRRGRYLRYKRGIAEGISRLAKDYHFQKLEGLAGGLFIDCGANVGELGIWARTQQMHYLAFEPEQQEATCCDLNNYNGVKATNRKALWKENTTLSFYSKAASADGSIFETVGSSKIEIDAVTLDSALHEMDLSRPVILKLEAEGAEPEVLEGARGSLSMIDWVSVDCGPEKGFAEEDTFVACHDILLAHGFQLVEVGFRRVTALYCNPQKVARKPQTAEIPVIQHD